MKKILITGCAGFIGYHLTKLYLLKNGFEEIDLGEEIKRNKPHKYISERFNDKMNRKVDFGFINKIENIIYFYSKKKINYLKFIASIIYAYDWALKIKIQLIKENNVSLSDAFFRNILIKKKFCLTLIFLIIYLRYFITTKNFFYLNCMKKVFFNEINLNLNLKYISKN